MKKLLFILSLMSLLVSCGGGSDEDEIPVQTIPQLTTKPIIHITSNTAVSGGKDIDDGGSAISKKGMCWSRNPTPTIFDETSLDCNGSQSYISDLKQMQPNTTYYTRAYATNYIGTGYGNEFSFTTDDGGYPLNVYEGSIQLRNQQEVNSFGANHYTHITGNVIITGGFPLPTSIVTNLEALSSITTIEGSLYIWSNSLTNLEGLNNLESVGDVFDIKNVNDLTSTLALNSLRSVGGGFQIESNDSLEHIEGLTNLTSVGALFIASNFSLIDIDGFNNLTNDLYLLTIADNDMLENVDGLIGVSAVNYYLGISRNNNLTNLNGLSNLAYVGNNVGISYNNQLVNLDGLSSLNTIAGGITVIYNDALENLNGLSSSNIGVSIRVTNNDVLNDLCGIQLALVSGIDGSYTVNDNTYNPTQQDIIDGNCSL